MSESVDQEKETLEIDNSTVKEMIAEMLKKQDEIFESLTTRIGKIESEQQRLKILEGYPGPNEDGSMQFHTPKRKETDRRSSLATRDLGKLLETKSTSQIIHTPQSFKLNNKLGDILKFSDYRELVQQIKRFKTRPGNAEVDIFLYREEYMNDTLRAWTLTRLHLYYGSERARAIGEYHQHSSSELVNMESLEFLCVLEKVFVATNKEEYRRFFKRIVEEVKQRTSCKALTVASLRYLIADFEMFCELMSDALVVNPEKVHPDDAELGLWHPGLRYNKNLEEEGMLTIVMEWFPPQLMKTIRSRMVGESKIHTIVEWIRSFKTVLQDFATVEAKYHDILVSVSNTTNAQKGPTTVRREMQQHDRSGYIHNIEQEEQSTASVEIKLPDQQDDPPSIESEKEDSGEDMLEEKFEENLNNLIGRPFPKKVEDRRASFNKHEKHGCNWSPEPSVKTEQKAATEEPCLRFMKTGKCDTPKCAYSHDPGIIRGWIADVKVRMDVKSNK
jgi:hypothetical protein